MTELLAIDLFSGCGGLTEGLKQAGFRVIAGAELRVEARAAYGLNHPDVHLFDDVRLVSSESLNAVQPLPKGRLDLLAACPPCQGFSSLRTRNHLTPAPDERNNLIFEVLRIASELEPKAILVENVPALLENWRIAHFRADLHKLGYKTNTDVLDAANFGVPQRRKRMIFIAIRCSVVPSIPSPTTSKPLTVRETIGDLPAWDAKDAPVLHRWRQHFSPAVLERVKLIPKDGGSRRHLGEAAQLPCHTRQAGFNDVYGRLSWDKVCGTITRSCHNPSKGRYLHPSLNRALTLYEAMLLQGFPKNYQLPTDGGIEKTASLIGEAFPPPFARAQAEHIKNLLTSMGELKSEEP
jgi:DNA (cytosine-5)-methyltransferase 1